MTNEIIQVEHLTKIFSDGDKKICAVNDVSFCIERGSFVVFLGPSGSGKTTLFNIIACLDVPTSGSVFVNGVNITSLSDRNRTYFRRNVLGIVFQYYNLLSDMTAFENIRLGSKVKEGSLSINEITEKLGIKHLLHRYPHQLSGGQQQRVAIARALVKDAEIIICDEPTSALDSRASKDFLDIIKSSSQEFGKTILLITHNADIANYADRALCLHDGKIADKS